MEDFSKFRICVKASKAGKEYTSYVDLFTKATLETVTRIVNFQIKHCLKFPVEIEIELLPQSEFLFQSCSSVYQVVSVVVGDFANVFYYGC